MIISKLSEYGLIIWGTPHEFDRPDNTPTSVNVVNFYPDIIRFVSSNQDWDKQEDQNIFKKYRMRNRIRIMG